MKLIILFQKALNQRRLTARTYQRPTLIVQPSALRIGQRGRLNRVRLISVSIGISLRWCTNTADQSHSRAYLIKSRIPPPLVDWRQQER